MAHNNRLCTPSSQSMSPQGTRSIENTWRLHLQTPILLPAHLQGYRAGPVSDGHFPLESQVQIAARYFRTLEWSFPERLTSVIPLSFEHILWSPLLKKGSTTPIYHSRGTVPNVCTMLQRHICQKIHKSQQLPIPNIEAASLF